MNWWSGWFGRKDAPGPNAPIPAWAQGPERSGIVRNYAGQVAEVYRDNPVGLRSVRLVAGAVAGLTIYDHANAAAERLVGAAGLLERIAAGLLLHGNAYVVAVADEDDRLVELATIRPERVSLVTGTRGTVQSYRYRGAGRDEIYPARDPLYRQRVAHLAAFNPSDDHEGLGCLNAAIRAATIHNRAAKWNLALLDNAARPSGALTYDPGDGSVLGHEQFDRLKAHIEEHFAGSANAGRPLLLEGGLKWQAMAMTPAEMDFVALKESAARDIALAFGVPPVLVGLPGDATYANAREAGRALYRQTVIPLAQRILAGLTPMLADWTGETRLEIDLDRISELAEDRAELWRQVGAADFLSAAEKREQLGFAAETDQ